MLPQIWSDVLEKLVANIARRFLGPPFCSNPTRPFSSAPSDNEKTISARNSSAKARDEGFSNIVPTDLKFELRMSFMCNVGRHLNTNQMPLPHLATWLFDPPVIRGSRLGRHYTPTIP